LIDEPDARRAFEAYLLEILSDFQVTIPNSAPSRGRIRRRHRHLEPATRKFTTR